MALSFKVNGHIRSTGTGLLILFMCSGLDYVFVVCLIVWWLLSLFTIQNQKQEHECKIKLCFGCFN